MLSKVRCRVMGLVMTKNIRLCERLSDRLGEGAVSLGYSRVLVLHYCELYQFQREHSRRQFFFDPN